MFKIKNNEILLKGLWKSRNNKTYLLKIKAYSKRLFLNNFSFNFCEKIKNKEESTINKRYEYDYEAPEDSNYEYVSKIRKYLDLLIRICLFSFGFYYFFLQKMNILTKKREPFLLNQLIELKASNFFSKKIQEIFKNYIYLHEHIDVQRVLHVYKQILNSNKIPSSKINQNNIFIIQNDSIGCLILKNGDLFISSRLVEICNKNENHLAMFIANELAFQAMGLDTRRMLKIYFHKKQEKSKFLSKVLYQGNELKTFSFVEKKEKQLEYFNRFLLFYPESIILNYFEEKEILKVALKFIKNSNYDLLEVFLFFKKFFF